MIRFLSIIFLIINVSICYSQSISVSSFKLLDSDLTANTAGTMEQDQNGDVAALIKVVTTQTGFTFDGGAMGVVKTKQTPGEIWVYVPHGSKKITIKHPQLGVLRDYYYPISIESARTYEMVLVSGTVQTLVKQTSNNQYLVIKVKPSDAVVEVNNEILSTSDGIAQKFVKLGTYEYRIQAKDYHTAAGKVTVDNPNEKKILEVNLQPAFGWIEIPSDTVYNDAQVFIDNKLEGTIPLKSKNFSSGEHSIKIVKPLYNPFSQTVIVKDNETTLVTPNLSPNFSEVTVTVDNNAEIYINDEKKGSGSWTGKLASGSYLIEAKKEGYRNTAQTFEISSNKRTQDIRLKTPTPIYGELNITSTPTLAEVFIDDEKQGETPLYIPQILIGKHKLLLKHEDCNDYAKDFNILEDEINNINAELDFIEFTTIKTNVSSAEIFVDGQLAGRGIAKTKLLKGIHQISVKANDWLYLDYNEKIEITKGTNLINIILEDSYYEIIFVSDILPTNQSNIYISIDEAPFQLWTGGNEWKEYLNFGEHKIEIKYKRKRFKQNIMVDRLHQKWMIKTKSKKIINI